MANLKERWEEFSYNNPPSKTVDFIRQELQAAAEIARESGDFPGPVDEYQAGYKAGSVEIAAAIRKLSE